MLLYCVPSIEKKLKPLNASCIRRACALTSSQYYPNKYLPMVKHSNDINFLICVHSNVEPDHISRLASFSYLPSKRHVITAILTRDVWLDRPTRIDFSDFSRGVK